VTAVEWVSTTAGALLVLGALQDVFQTLLHPGGVAHIAPNVFRGLWRAGRRIGPRATGLAGPLGFVVTLVIWAGAVLLGWALIYWPHLPEGFLLTSGLDPALHGGPLDAVWVSGVTLTTVGFGDITAEETPLRLAQVAEAIIGFALITAGISWVLSIYPALSRSRALAGRVESMLVGDGDDVRLAPGDPPAVLAVLLHGIADQVAEVRVDLIHFPSTYFFRAPAPELALAEPLQQLERALRRDDLPSEARTAAAAAQRAVEELAETLREGPFGVQGEDAASALEHVTAAHRH